MLWLGHVLFFFFFLFFLGCFALLHASWCKGMVPSAGRLQRHRTAVRLRSWLSPSEQLQTSSDVVHHLFLPHDGEDSTRTSLHLGEPGVLYQVGGKAEAHGQGLQL